MNLSQGRILLVDDNASTLLVLRMLLERSGYMVDTAGTLADALQRANARRPDLLISDISLPDGTGIDLLRQLRGDGTIRAIAISGYCMEADIERGIDAGFAAYLAKPFGISNFLDIISNVMDRPA